jgi:2-methylisocitrate lyase-like PEP mutase family enzyme
MDDTINRLKAFEAAGANVLYAPGINSLDQLRQITAELKRPFNVLAPFFREVTVEEFSAAGARRISVGGALNWASVNPLLKAGQEMLDQGTFSWTADMASGRDVKKLLSGPWSG